MNDSQILQQRVQFGVSESEFIGGGARALQTLVEIEMTVLQTHSHPFSG